MNIILFRENTHDVKIIAFNPFIKLQHINIILCFFREFKVEYFMHAHIWLFWIFEEIFKKDPLSVNLFEQFKMETMRKRRKNLIFLSNWWNYFTSFNLTKFHKCQSVEKQEIILRLKNLSWKQLLLNKDVDFTEDLQKSREIKFFYIHFWISHLILPEMIHM